jgi:hypothetical protein
MDRVGEALLLDDLHRSNMKEEEASVAAEFSGFLVSNFQVK